MKKQASNWPWQRMAGTLGLWLASAGQAQSHDSWISRYQYQDPHTNAWCCDERDCAALDSADVRPGGSGFIIQSQYYVPLGRVLPSGDNRFWACFNEEGTGAHDRPRGVRCFFAPMLLGRTGAAVGPRG